MKNKTVTIAMEEKNFTPTNTFINFTEIDGKKAVRVIMDPNVKLDDEPTYARLVGADFQNGTIAVQVLSRLLPDAPSHARGFIGVAFRIDEKDAKFESIYIRPTNGRVEDAFRHKHATQYFSYPDYKYGRLRIECPEKYETSADIGLNEWIDLKIEVAGETANLYINGSEQPVLRVSDLIHGADAHGGIGLWVGIGTEGYFSGLTIEKG